jgi:hypothetical protein
MRIISLIFLVIISNTLIAQQKIQVVDGDTNEPVPGVLIELLDSQNKRVDAQVTSIDGITQFNKVGNYTFRASHISYQTFEGH